MSGNVNGTDTGTNNGNGTSICKSHRTVRLGLAPAGSKTQQRAPALHHHAWKCLEGYPRVIRKRPMRACIQLLTLKIHTGPMLHNELAAMTQNRRSNRACSGRALVHMHRASSAPQSNTANLSRVHRILRAASGRQTCLPSASQQDKCRHDSTVSTESPETHAQNCEIPGRDTCPKPGNARTTLSLQ